MNITYALDSIDYTREHDAETPMEIDLLSQILINYEVFYEYYHRKDIRSMNRMKNWTKDAMDKYQETYGYELNVEFLTLRFRMDELLEKC